jgi:hypoxanthine phosphoribosyltransferase
MNNTDKIDVFCIILIIIIHIIFINKLEKTLFYEKEHGINDRPDCDYSDYNKVECMGTPSGHVEILIIMSYFVCICFPEYLRVIIPVAIILIILMCIQRIITKRHNLYQVIYGIFFGIMYSFMYKSFSPKKSMIACSLVLFILLILCIIKNDHMIKNQKIPDYVDKSLYQIIDKKMNKKEKYFELFYLSLFPEKIKYYTWEKFEKYTDKLVGNIDINKIDIIVGIKSGGAFIANYIGEKYNKKYTYIKFIKVTENDAVRHLMKTLGIETHTKIEEINIEDIKDKNVLLTDDIKYSGKTINTASSYLMENGAKSVTQFILYEYNVMSCYIFPWGYCS